MSDQREDEAPRQRRYPELYERAVPLCLVSLLVGIVVLLLIIAAVAFGWFGGPAR